MRAWVDSRRPSVVVAVALLAMLIAIPLGVLAQTTSSTFVTGSVTTKDPVTFSSSAVAVIILVDRSARGEGAILGMQRKTDLGGSPVSFKVRYDPARIIKDHAYVLFAAVIDGDKRWQNGDGAPAITGGPTSGVDVRVKKVSATPPATIDGEILKKDKSALSGKAVALAAVLDLDTGRTVTWTAITPSGDVPIAFSLGYDPGTVDQGGNLVAWGAIVDKTSVWEADGGSPLLAAGPNLSAGSIMVLPTVPLPVAPSPTPTPTPVTIPGVKNLPQAEAVDVIESADLRVGETTKSFNGKVAKGNAIKTKPEAGNEVPPQTALTLVISKGPSPSPAPTATPKPTAKPTATPKPTAKPTATPKPTAKPTATPKPTAKPVAVPEVRNQPEADAVITITDAGLRVGERPRWYHDKVAAGNAIKTEPAAGTMVPPGSSIKLFISKGPAPTPSPSPTPSTVKVPGVKGMSEADAVVALTDAGLLIGERIRRTHESVSTGDVIKTDPAGGTLVPRGSRVDLYVSTGPAATPTPKPVTVPDVRGMPEPDAIIALTDAGLQIGQRFREEDGLVPVGEVIETDPGAGSKVAPGTFVDLIVSSGPRPTPTPVPTPSPSPAPPGSPAPWPHPIAGPGFLSGSLVYLDQDAPGPFRRVVLTLLEEGPSGSRVVPSSPYIAEGSSPLGFAISFDWAEIDPTATYRVLAAIVDGDQSWYSTDGAAAITGGAPVTGLIVPLFQRGDILEGQVSGVILGVDSGLSEAAVREAFLVRADTGAVIAFDSGLADPSARLQVFAVPYLLEDIEEGVDYLVVARVVDGPRVWTGPGVPVISNGVFQVAVEVTPVVGPAPMLAESDG